MNAEKKKLKKNKFGIVQYPKGDARRLFVILAAIDRLPRPTITSLSKFTGHNKGTIQRDIEKITEQFGVLIIKQESVYRIDDWGLLLKKKSIRRFFDLIDVPAD